MKNKIITRVLEFFCEPLNFGGQEAFILNVYQKFNNVKISYTFCTPFECQNEKMKKILKENNDKIIYLDYKFETKLRKINLVKGAKKILKNNNYDVIHIHSGSIFSLYTVAKLAKKSGIKKVIIHSHATGYNTLQHKIIKKITGNKMEKYVDYYLACSEDAAKWKFPNNIIKKGKYQIVKNGIDIEKFKFNEKIRNEYREKLGLNNKFVICHIGRFDVNKNQRFLVDIFKEIQKDYKNAILLLVGDGEEKNKIESIVKNYQISNNVIFLGIRNDIDKILQAVDLFVFPSIFEGLGIAAIEAQAAGLKTLVSENIPDEANISELFERISLENKEEWIKKIEHHIKTSGNIRKDMSSIIRAKGYDSKESAKKLEYIYMD
jgi:glycosyltransferase